jgi:hypothetical protein
LKKARYHGDLDVRLLQDGRVVQLLGPFGYTDPAGVDWLVPKDARVDGASIPRPLWSLIGGPFTGKYREASVIHDWYCDLRSRPWRDTHRVFYHGMVTSGVDPLQAKVMYAGVYAGGPRWSETVVHNVRLRPSGDRPFGPAGPQGPLYKPEFEADGLPKLYDEEERVVMKAYTPDVPEALYGQLEAQVRSRDPSLAEIERLADELAPDPEG